jgi:thiamine biosynthesis lipoprotein
MSSCAILIREETDAMTGVLETGRRRPVGVVSAIAGIGLVAASASSYLAPPAIAETSSATVERRAWAMGTRLIVTVEAVHRSAALEASEAALRAVSEVEARLSTWTDDSELSRLNRASPGTDVVLSPELEADLLEAVHWWTETGGAFDPGVAILVDAWDLRGRGRVPSATELEASLSASGPRPVILEPGIARIERAGLGIDEGGFGKGVALRSAARAAREAGAGCVVLDFGGQISIEGSCGSLWIDIAHPDDRHRGLARLEVKAESVATSGNSERGLVVDGVRYGHVLDPRSGRPAADWGTVTVVADDPVTADCLSTALFVMGPEQSIEWLRGWPEIDAIFVDRTGEKTEMTATAGLEGRLEVFGQELVFVPPTKSLMTEDSP